jgi:excisionase family DNA binding protein
VSLLTPAEVAALWKVSRATISRLVREEKLPFEPILTPEGKRQLIRFDRARIEEWLSERRSLQVRRTLTGERFTRRAEDRGR